MNSVAALPSLAAAATRRGQAKRTNSLRVRAEASTSAETEGAYVSYTGKNGQRQTVSPAQARDRPCHLFPCEGFPEASAIKADLRLAAARSDAQTPLVLACGFDRREAEVDTSQRFAEFDPDTTPRVPSDPAV